MIPLLPFYFMRHAQTDWNLQDIAQGQQDIPLNARGLEQAQEVLHSLQGEKITSIAVSPLKRAQQTANAIAHYYQLPITIIHDLQEACWGVREGLSKDDGQWIQRWKEGRAIPQAETFPDFKKRVLNGIHQALTLPGPVLIVAHGGVYWALQEIFSLPFIDLPNCSALFHQPPAKPNHPWVVCDIQK